MKYLSVCSGIEAATVAWHPLGWQPVGFAEIEPFPAAVLAYHYPEVPNFGDMTKYKEWNLGTVELLVGGTPCQSFSVAGLRKGLADPRGNLALVYCGILDHLRPEWFVWENVPGVLSSNGGRDFGSFLGALAELGYGFAYRVLDAQYFGVAQRRRRVFVVGYLGDWRPAAEVLFERKSVLGHPAPSREKGKEVAGTFTARARSGGWGHDPNLAAGGYMQPVAMSSGQAGAEIRTDGGAPTLTCLHETPVVAIQGNLIGREVGKPRGAGASDDGVMYTLTKADVHGVAQPIPFGVAEQPDVGHCLRSGASKADKHESTTYVAQPVGVTLHGTDGTARIASFTETSSALRSRTPSGVENSTTTAVMQPIAFAQNQRDEVRELAVAGALAAEPGMKQQTYLAQPAAAFKWNMGAKAHGIGYAEEQSPTFDTKPDSIAVHQAMAVRRLTPVECERLQGFPDNYTNIPWRKQPESPDGPRYKALGNSMAVPVMAWIGRRIMMYKTQQTRMVA